MAPPLPSMAVAEPTDLGTVTRRAQPATATASPCLLHRDTEQGLSLPVSAELLHSPPWGCALLYPSCWHVVWFPVTKRMGSHPAPLPWQDTPSCWVSERLEVQDVREFGETREVSRERKCLTPCADSTRLFYTQRSHNHFFFFTIYWPFHCRAEGAGWSAQPPTWARAGGERLLPTSGV